MRRLNRCRWAVLPVLAGTLMLVPGTFASANESQESEQVSALFREAKREAVQLRDDAAEMKSFVGTAHWRTHADKIAQIKEHVNAVGRLIADLKAKEDECEPSQKIAIERVTPLLRELADNVTGTINHLSQNQSRVGMPPFRDYVNANYELANDIAGLITDFVDYENHKQNAESLEQKLKLAQD